MSLFLVIVLGTASAVWILAGRFTWKNTAAEPDNPILGEAWPLWARIPAALLGPIFLIGFFLFCLGFAAYVHHRLKSPSP